MLFFIADEAGATMTPTMQRARIRERAEKEAEQARDAKFNAEKPMVPGPVWVPKPNPPPSLLMMTPSPLMITPSPAVNDETGAVPVPAITYSSWADEVEAADLEAKDKPTSGESDTGSANGDSVDDLMGEDSAGDSELAMDDSENQPDEELLDYEGTPTRSLFFASREDGVIYIS